MKNFNYKAYWIERHRKYRGNIRSVGVKSYQDSANVYKYRLVSEQYDHALSRLNLRPNTQVLDVGAGTGEFISLFLNNKQVSQITAADISAIALEQLKQKHPSISTLTQSAAELKLADQSIELIYCFDVLYHIIPDTELEQSIKNLCRISRRYIIIHGRVDKRFYHFHSPHVKVRYKKDIDDMMKKCGFHETFVIPTHIFSQYFLLYRINNYMPRLFYIVDRYFLNQFQLLSRYLCSYAITVYERI